MWNHVYLWGFSSSACVCAFLLSYWFYFSTCLKADVIRFSPAVCWTSCCLTCKIRNVKMPFYFLQIAWLSISYRFLFFLYKRKFLYIFHDVFFRTSFYLLPDRPAQCQDRLKDRWNISKPATNLRGEREREKCDFFKSRKNKQFCRRKNVQQSE